MAVMLRVCGAARTVTGLSLLFQAGESRVLVDCGMFQGPKNLKSLNYEEFPYDPRSLDAVLLTHAHIDHSGLLPKLRRDGYRGPIHATRATADLADPMLRDAGHIQEMEVEQLNRRNHRRGRAEVQPIYTAEDAGRVLTQFRSVDYGEWIAPAKGVRARWWNAGHMLGSASIELEFEEAGEPLRVLVSGDLGAEAAPLQYPPEGPSGLDHVICESTYGDEQRPTVSHGERRQRLAEVMRSTAKAGGPLLIPVFAVERAQELMLDLVTLMDSKAVPEAPIFVDSPLAIRATKVFLQHAREMEEGRELKQALASRHLHFTESGEQSRAIAQQQGFHVVLAGSGMCEAGRIRHHLKRWLWAPSATVLLVGFQAEGTLGRLLRNGAPRVRIQGDTVEVKATISELSEYSAHADGPELARWLERRAPIKGGLFLVHGEPEAIEGLAKRAIGKGLVPEGAVIQPLLDECFLLEKGAPPQRQAAPCRRAEPERTGREDWHNARAALQLEMERALEDAPDDAARQALLSRLRDVLHA